jgi:hypothetical protein
VDLPDDIHAFDHISERGETLAIGIPLAAEIQFRLIADAN